LSIQRSFSARACSSPGAINEEAEGKGWFFRLKLSSPDELNELMSAEQYKAFLASLE